MSIPPGTIGLCRIGGALGWAIQRGQSIAGDPSFFTHAFVVMDETRVIQAMPTGAEFAPLKPYLEDRRSVFLRGWYGLDVDQVITLQREATRMIGTPYGFLDYVALAMPPRFRPARLRRFVESNRTMICSQLADELLRRCGVQLFQDGRHPADVTPGDLHIEWSLHVGHA